MTKPVRAAAAMLGILFALVFLSSCVSPPEQAHSRPAVAQEAGEHTGDGSARPELTGQARVRDRHDDVSRPADPPGPARAVCLGCPPAIDAGGAAVVAYGVVAAPYGMRRRRGGALPAVLQVFRC